MNEKKTPAKANYDFETDTFSAISLKRDYNSSFQKEDMVFDLDMKGQIVGLEILNASDNFKIPKAFLKNIKDIKIEIEVSDKLMKIKILVKTLIRNSEKTTALNLERIKPDFVNPSELNLAIS